jgi:serine/threonine-protein kinase
MAEADSPPPPLPESIGRYRIVRLLGEGAMGRVLLAHDPVLDREVAVKHLRGDLAIPDDVRRGLVTRMRHEARAAARVMHPHLVTLHDMGEDERFGLYLVFEYVEGPTLKERIAEGRLSPKDAARVSVELGTALTMAHDAGILHRDIKPENVILSKKGAKIADFGIAKIPDSTLTHQGGLMGTPAYSAPETFRTSTFSPESDQFSLAATLYEAVSGKRAFPGDDAVAVAQRILHESAELFAESLGLRPEVDRVLARALSRRPRERFPSCEAFGRALADALLAPPETPGVPDLGDGTKSGATPVGGAQSSGEHVASELPRERRGTQIALGVIAVAATGALLVRTALRTDEAPIPVVTAVPTASVVAPTSASAPRPRAIAPRPSGRLAQGSPSSAASGSSSAAPAPGDSASGPGDSAAAAESAPQENAPAVDTAPPGDTAAPAPPRTTPPDAGDAGR